MTDVLLCAQMRTARGAVQQCHWHCQWSTVVTPQVSARARRTGTQLSSQSGGRESGGPSGKRRPAPLTP